MKKLYNEFFYVPKHGKVKEKVMLMRTAMTVIIMVVCLFAMSFTAYAYFSHNVTSGSNIIKAAYFDAQITVNNSTNDIVLTKDGKYQTATLPAGEYIIKLERGSSTADTGFCIITIDDTDYYTQQIGVDVGRNLTDGSASVKFTLKVSSATEIKILSHWGTFSCYGYENTSDNPLYIKSDDVIDLTDSNDSNGEGDNSDGQDGSGTKTDTTTPPTTDTTTGSEPSNTTPSTTEPTGTSEPTESTTEPTTSTSTEPTVIEPVVTEPAATESTDTTEGTETQPAEEITGAPTTEASE